MDSILKRHRLHPGHRRRADEGPRQGPALQIFRRRPGPRRDHGLHPGSADAGSARSCRAPSTHWSTRQHGGEEDAARGRTGRTRPLTAAPVRSTARSRASFWINLRTTDLHRKYGLADLDLPRGHPRPRLAGRIYAQAAADPARCSPSTPTRKAGRSMREQLGDELGAYDGNPVGRARLSPVHLLPRLRLVVDTGLHAMQWTREQARRLLRQRQRLEPATKSQTKSTAIAPGRARRAATRSAISTINRLRDKAKAALGRSTT